MAEDLDDLAGAVADGDDIDWKAAHARTSPDSRSVVEGLESISHFSAAVPASDRPSRRLPVVLEIARVAAAVRVFLALAGFIVSARLPLMAAVVATFGAAALYLDLGGKDRRARALAACFWTTASGFAARGVAMLMEAWPAATWLGIVASMLPEALFAAAVWQFARDFPRVTRFSPLDLVCEWGLRVTLTIGTALFAAGLAAHFGGPAVARVLAPLYRSNGVDVMFWFLVFGPALAGLLVMGWRSRGVHGNERTRVRLFLWAVVVAFGPIGIQIVALILVPAYLRLLQSSPEAYLLSAVVVYPPMLALPFLTAYAVAARDVLNVRLVVQQGLRYLLARWLVLWGALVPLGLLLAHLYRYANLTLGTALITEPAPTLLWFAGVGVIVLAFRGSLIRALDEWALPGIEDPAATLAAMSERMRLARTPLEVAGILAEATERAIQAPAKAFLFVDDALVPVSGGEAVLPAESAIPALMEGAREPVIVSGTQRRSYYSLLLQTDRAWIDEQRIEVIVPVVAGRAGSGLLGLVTLSSRRNALGFTDDDLRFVRAAAASASLACDAIVSEGRRTEAAGTDGLDEVALQCQRCGAVHGWSKDAVLCACGGAWEPAALPKRLLERFDLQRLVGSGGMGIVYRALDLTLGRDVALKTLPELSRIAAERLVGEARAMASLSHDDVAVLFEVARWRGTPVLVMEYLAGGTLAGRFRRSGIRDADLVALVQLIALALGRVHARGLYHGDVKPSNIGFAGDGTPKLLDFGLARALTADDLHGDGTTLGRAALGGTWAYLAPDVRDGAAAGPKLDLWALGVVLCEGLLGAHPFPRARSRDEVVTGRELALAQLRRTRSDAHGQTVARMLAIDPAERPATAAEFVTLLAALN